MTSNTNVTSSFDVDRLRDKFQALNSTQDSIQTLSLWIIHHKAHCEKIIEIWLKVFKKSKSRQKLNMLYLANDVIQNSKKRNARIFITVFKRALIEAVFNIKDDTIKGQVTRILNILRDRKFYDKAFIDDLLEALGEKGAKNSKDSTNSQIINNPTVKGNSPRQPASKSGNSENYKPNDLFLEINKIDKLSRDLNSKETDVEKCLSNFDLNSKQWVKNYKDKVSGQRLDTNLENCSLKLESYIPFLEAFTKDRNTLIKNLKKATQYYSAIYEDAKFVSLAYKKYGTRVSNVQQKLKLSKDSFLSNHPENGTSDHSITGGPSEDKIDAFAHDLLMNGDSYNPSKAGPEVDPDVGKNLLQNLSKLVGSMQHDTGSGDPSNGIRYEGLNNSIHHGFNKDSSSIGIGSDFLAGLHTTGDTDLRPTNDAHQLQDVDLRIMTNFQAPTPEPASSRKSRAEDSLQITDMELGYDEELSPSKTPIVDDTATCNTSSTPTDLDNRIDSLFIKQDVDARQGIDNGFATMPHQASSTFLLLPPPPPPPPLMFLSPPKVPSERDPSHSSTNSNGSAPAPHDTIANRQPVSTSFRLTSQLTDFLSGVGSGTTDTSPSHLSAGSLDHKATSTNFLAGGGNKDKDINEDPFSFFRILGGDDGALDVPEVPKPLDILTRLIGLNKSGANTSSNIPPSKNYKPQVPSQSASPGQAPFLGIATVDSSGTSLPTETEEEGDLYGSSGSVGHIEPSVSDISSLYGSAPSKTNLTLFDTAPVIYRPTTLKRHNYDADEGEDDSSSPFQDYYENAPTGDDSIYNNSMHNVAGDNNDIFDDNKGTRFDSSANKISPPILDRTYPGTDSGYRQRQLSASFETNYSDSSGDHNSAYGKVTASNNQRIPSINNYHHQQQYNSRTGPSVNYSGGHHQQQYGTTGQYGTSSGAKRNPNLLVIVGSRDGSHNSGNGGKSKPNFSEGFGKDQGDIPSYHINN